MEQVIYNETDLRCFQGILRHFYTESKNPTYFLNQIRYSSYLKYIEQYYISIYFLAELNK